MGGSSWSADAYSARSTTRKASGKDTFAHSSAVKSGKVAAKAHDTLDASKMKAGKRECRDSDDHPNSKAVFVGLDVTASMSSVPRQMQEKLPLLMGLLLRKGYLEDPAICLSGIGDVKSDKVPFQVGQFESGIEIDNDITNLYLEGGGGGNMHESYEMALYFLAHCTSCDAFEKRGEKGYAFIIGDEELQPHLDRNEAKLVFGDECNLESNVPMETLMASVLEKWELYHIRPNMTCHVNDEKYMARWKDLLNERVLFLDDPNGISELIASTIGILEDNADLSSIASDLTGEGVDAGTADAVGRALATVGSSSIAKSTEGTGLSTL